MCVFLLLFFFFGGGGVVLFLFLHGDEDVLEDVSLVEFMCFVFAWMPDESYCRRFRSVCCCVRGMSFESCISVCCRVCMWGGGWGGVLCDFYLF